MISRTVIWFMVSVPVLSELIAEVEPSVSTAGSVFMMAFFLAMATEPVERIVVTTAGSASGMDPTARATPMTKRSANASPWLKPITTITTKANSGRDDDEDREPVDLLGERRLLGLLSRQHGGDVPHLRTHARGGDQDLAVAAGDVGVHEGHVDAVAQRHVGSDDGLGVLLDGHALAGQRAFLDLQRRRHDHPAVGRHAVAGIDQHDVAGHDLVGGDLDHVAVAPHLGDRLHHLAEGRCGGLGFAFLVIPQPRVEEGQQDQPHAGAVLGDEQADDRCDHQHDLHVVRVVLEELLPDRLRLCLGEGVGSVLLQTRLRLGCAQALRRIDAQLLADLFRSQRVPGRRRGCRCRRVHGRLHLVSTSRGRAGMGNRLFVAAGGLTLRAASPALWAPPRRERG